MGGQEDTWGQSRPDNHEGKNHGWGMLSFGTLINSRKKYAQSI